MMLNMFITIWLYELFDKSYDDFTIKTHCLPLKHLKKRLQKCINEEAELYMNRTGSMMLNQVKIME